MAAALACYGVWGLLPVLFHAVEAAGAGSFETVAWRTLWAVPCAALLVLAAGQQAWLRRAPMRTLAALALSALLIAVNWSVYVWAVGHGRTLEGSLGYYLNPLLAMAAGRLLFGEPISRTGWLAVAIAALGVALQAVALGAFPWVAVALAASFCGYAIVRKRVGAPAQAGLLVECLVLAPVATLYLAAFAAHGHGVFGHGWRPTLLLALCGPATAIPLALFAFAANRLPLTMIGFLQFLSPTLQFLVGLSLGEHLTPLRAASFLLIWIGVAVFALDAWRRHRRGASADLAP